MIETIREELKRLEDSDGRLTPEAVVSAARDPNNPLHGLFEWDDSAAAESWRIDQARRLIRAVPLVVTDQLTTVSTVHYVRDPGADPRVQGYVAVERLFNDGDLAGKAVRYELARAEAAMERADNLARALKVSPVIQTAKRHVSKARARVERFFEAAKVS